MGEAGTKVNVTEQILLKNSQIPRNPGGTEHVQTGCIRLFFSPPTHESESLGTRLIVALNVLLLLVYKNEKLTIAHKKFSQLSG